MSSEPGAPPRVHEFTLRVTYADTDKMGVVYYANYLRFFEQARTELLRSLGARYRDIEEKRKLYLPAAQAGYRYLSPARYDDLLLARTWLARLGPASVEFVYEIRDAQDPGQLRVLGRTRHAVVDAFWKPARLPEDLRAALRPFLGAPPAGLRSGDRA